MSGIHPPNGKSNYLLLDGELGVTLLGSFRMAPAFAVPFPDLVEFRITPAGDPS